MRTRTRRHRRHSRAVRGASLERLHLLRSSNELARGLRSSCLFPLLAPAVVVNSPASQLASLGEPRPSDIERIAADGALLTEQRSLPLASLGSPPHVGFEFDVNRARLTASGTCLSRLHRHF